MDISNINRREIYRYLSYKNIIPDDNEKLLIEDVLQQCMDNINPRYMTRRVRLLTKEKMVTLFDTDTDKEIACFESEKLADNLYQCEEVVLFCGTLGVEADTFIHRLSIMNMAKASVAQACFSAVIEAFCNEKQEELRKTVEKEGLYLRPRFSPGYGDLKLEAQRDFFNSMEITKRLGVTLTDSCLMAPTKSVTAFIGLTRNSKGCHISKCSSCENKECEFRDEKIN